MEKKEQEKYNNTKKKKKNYSKRPGVPEAVGDSDFI